MIIVPDLDFGQREFFILLSIFAVYGYYNWTIHVQITAPHVLDFARLIQKKKILAD